MRGLQNEVPNEADAPVHSPEGNSLRVRQLDFAMVAQAIAANNEGLLI